MINPQAVAFEVIIKNSITEPHVKIDDIIASYDIFLTTCKLPDKISGVLNIDEQGHSSIIINEEHSPTRQNFSKAHELGHFLMHKHKGMHVDKNAYFFRSNDNNGYHITEIEANRFAAELLMPSFLIQKVIEKKNIDNLDMDIEDSIEELADLFKVSEMAMSLRLNKLGFLNNRW